MPFDARGVAIAGAGPAGTAAAITLASCGIPAIIVERHLFPRYRPGETLHPGVEPVFQQLGVAHSVNSAGFIRHHGVWIESPAGNRFRPFGRGWSGYQAPGSVLDLILLNRAIELGVQALQPCSVRDVIVDGGRVSGLRTTTDDLRCSFVIDATGRSRFLARTLKLAVRRHSRPMIAQCGYRTGDCAAIGRDPRLNIAQDQWVWSARIGPDTYHWCRVGSAKDPLKSGFVPSSLRNLRVARADRAFDVTWLSVPACAGPGYFIAGDAAASLDPAFGNGVLQALMSGIAAARMAAVAIESRSVADAAGEAYRNWAKHSYLRSARGLSSTFGANFATTGDAHQSGQDLPAGF